MKLADVYFLTLVGFLLAGPALQSPLAVCPDVAPCECRIFGAVRISCSGDQVTSGDELREIFRRPFPSATVPYVTLDSLSFSVPANVFADKTISNLLIACQYTNENKLEPIDPAAFEGQGPTVLSFMYCNMTSVNFQFLGSFQNLTKLDVWDSFISDLNTIPLVPTLTSAFFHNTPIKDWYNPQNTPNLVYLGISAAGKDDVGRIADYFSQYYNLRALNLRSNGLNYVPAQIRGIEMLELLDLGNNSIEVLSSGAIQFTSRPTTILLTDNPLAKIEPEAIQGDLSKALLDLSKTRLTTLDEDFFRPVVEMMWQTQLGRIDLEGITTFVCGCDIAWLIRDNSYLMAFFRNGVCADGTPFYQVGFGNFADCP